jgi:hypothetical protein
VEIVNQRGEVLQAGLIVSLVDGRRAAARAG